MFVGSSILMSALFEHARVNDNSNPSQNQRLTPTILCYDIAEGNDTIIANPDNRILPQHYHSLEKCLGLG